jgi:hypothetical protein
MYFAVIIVLWIGMTYRRFRSVEKPQEFKTFKDDDEH